MGEKPFPYTSPTTYFKILENHPDGKGPCCSAVSYSSREHPVQLLGKAPRVKFTCSFDKLFTEDALVGKGHKSVHVS